MEYENIWNMSKDVIEKNSDVKEEILSDDANEDKVADNINGYVINDVGNIVAQFGFFVENADNDTISVKISPDGFLSKIYNEDTNIIIGYGHELGFTGLINPEKSQILHLGPEAANGDDIKITVSNDDTLKEQGVIILMRADDVDLNLLSEDVREDFKQSLEDSKDVLTDLNDIETDYNNYMKHVYVLLSDQYKNDVEVDEEENYE